MVSTGIENQDQTTYLSSPTAPNTLLLDLDWDSCCSVGGAANRVAARLLHALGRDPKLVCRRLWRFRTSRAMSAMAQVYLSWKRTSFCCSWT
jgi:hypothetical protein